MLEWTAAGSGAPFMGLVHHTDAQREWAYDRTSPVGRLDKAWDKAVRRGWTVTNMKTEWTKVFAFLASLRPCAGHAWCENAEDLIRQSMRGSLQRLKPYRRTNDRRKGRGGNIK